MKKSTKITNKINQNKYKKNRKSSEKNQTLMKLKRKRK